MNTDRFKAKALTLDDNPKWVEGYPVFDDSNERLYIKDGQHNKRFGCGIEVQPNTLCQCTGFKDSQGKVGFDNDYFTDSQGETYIIGWRNGWYGLSIERGHDISLGMGKGILQLMTLTGKNIHDINQ